MNENMLESVKDFEAALSGAISDAGLYLQRCAVDYETRKCLWPGQSDDGRKHGDDLGKVPFPWEGASDTRIRLADEVIGDNSRVTRAATKRLTIQAKPVDESGDVAESVAMTKFLRWLLQSKMADNLRREIPLLSNWQETYSAAVLAVTWEDEVQVEKVPVFLADLQMEVLQAAENPETAEVGRLGVEMLGALWDRTREGDVAEWLMARFRDLKPGAARAAVRRLRRTGACVVPERRVTRSQPVWTACRVMHDVFFPANTFDLQKSPWVAWREVIAPEDLRARVMTDGYDEDVVEDAVARCTGKTLLDAVHYGNDRAMRSVLDDMEGLVELMHFFRRVTDGDGFLKIEVTSFIPGLEDAVKEYEQPYTHGLYPFVDFVRDRTERIIMDNDSVPGVVQTHQQEVKTQRDFRADRSSVAILPPIKVPYQRAKGKLEFGPGAIIPERRPGEVAWMQPPAFDGDTVNLEKQVRADVDSYFGRMVDGVSPQRQQLYQQAAVDDFLSGMQLAARQTLALARQYYDDALFARVTGTEMRFALSDEEVTAEWDIMLDFNAGDLNNEVVLKKLAVIGKTVLPLDTEGVVDRVGLVEWAMRSVDPSLASQIVQPREVATNREREQEMLEFAKIAAGVEPEMKPGQNYALRLSVLEGIIKANPALQQRYASDEIFRKLVDARMQHFQFQLTQRQNAEIGRLGAMPALGGE